MTVEEAFQLIENLDYAEGLRRKLAPSHSLLQINRDGDIVSVERFREPSTEAEQIAALNKYPGTIQINARPGMYESADELRERIQKSMWLFSKMKAGATESTD
jgi:hypothetical protein